MAQEGILITWHGDRGYGFIRPDGGGGDVFVHISEFAGAAPCPAPQVRVYYNISTDDRGRTQAVNVRCGRILAPKSRNTPFETALAGFAVITILILTAYLQVTPRFLTAHILIMSTAAIAVYGIDKFAAVADFWRVPEVSLHAFAIAGGWPGALIAQWLFNHKTRKASFQALFAGTVVLNCLVVGLWIAQAS